MLHTFCLYCHSCDEFDLFEQVLFDHFPYLHKFILVHPPPILVIFFICQASIWLRACSLSTLSWSAAIVSFVLIRSWLPMASVVRLPLVFFVSSPTTSTKSSSSSSESVVFALSVLLVMALALVLIVLGPALVRLSLVLSVLHLYGVTTGAMSSSDESDWVRFRLAPPLVFPTPLFWWQLSCHGCYYADFYGTFSHWSRLVSSKHNCARYWMKIMARFLDY